MTNNECLQNIIEEAHELLGYVAAGGDKQYAFDLMVHPDELRVAHDKLYDLGTRIRAELA